MHLPLQLLRQSSMPTGGSRRRERSKRRFDARGRPGLQNGQRRVDTSIAHAPEGRARELTDFPRGVLQGTGQLRGHVWVVRDSQRPNGRAAHAWVFVLELGSQTLPRKRRGLYEPRDTLECLRSDPRVGSIHLLECERQQSGGQAA